MVATGVDDQLSVLNDKDEPVLFVNANTPPSGEIPRKRLRLADAIISVALDAGDERVDALQRTAVKPLPFEVLIPREVMLERFHGSSPRSVRADGSCAFRCRNRP